jgi:hypothetical protein
MGCCDKIITGATGLTKAALGIDNADEATIRARREVCRRCDKSEKRNMAGIIKIRMCSACDCFIGPKTRLADEECPEGKWTRLTPSCRAGGLRSETALTDKAETNTMRTVTTTGPQTPHNESSGIELESGP